MFQRKVKLGPNQESVWDYPRPPRVEACPDAIVVEFGGVVVARSDRAVRVLETSHPPTIYIPRADVVMEHLVAVPGTTMCEFKGVAVYFDVAVAERVGSRAAWSYPNPAAGFEALRGAIAFYPGRVDAAYIGSERVRAQEGDFYGGWITSRIVGPFKGGAGSSGW